MKGLRRNSESFFCERKSDIMRNIVAERFGYYGMNNNQWYKDKVFYQIWPRSFKDGNGDGMGDLIGVYEKLDYIISLGCDGIWFSPLYPSPGVDCGYDMNNAKVCLCNYKDAKDFNLRPYEARVYLWKK